MISQVKGKLTYTNTVSKHSVILISCPLCKEIVEYGSLCPNSYCKKELPPLKLSFIDRIRLLFPPCHGCSLCIYGKYK
jgi:hypothetical protein